MLRLRFTWLAISEADYHIETRIGRKQHPDLQADCPHLLSLERQFHSTDACCPSIPHTLLLDLSLNYLLAIADKMKAHTAFLLAVQMIFMAYVLSSATTMANGATFRLAVELLRAAELFSRGLVPVLRRIVGILAPRTARSILSSTVRVLSPLIINLLFISFFLEQLQPEAPAIDSGVIDRSLNAIESVGHLLLVSGLPLILRCCLLVIRNPGPEEDHRIIGQLQYICVLLDVFLSLTIVSISHLLFWKILDGVHASANISETNLENSGILNYIDGISKVRLLLCWVLQVQKSSMRELEGIVPHWIIDGLNFPE